MSRDRVLEQLWARDPEPMPGFDPAMIGHLPAPARRYFEHAIAPGTPLARAVRLHMHGSIRLEDAWHGFEAEQVIRAGQGFVWHAHVRLHGLPVDGFDRFVEGEGAMRWKLLGIIPIVKAAGPDVSRSAEERVQLEAMWLPPMLLERDVSWSARDDEHLAADITLSHRHALAEFVIDHDGRLRSASMQRWGSPTGEGFAALPFGGLVEDERSFDGYTIPSQLRVGWYFGSDKFEPEGEFFRCTIDEATYR